MREALGGYWAYIVIALFVVVVSGFMAFSISYNKAFQMKNKAISVIEKYDNKVKEHEKEITAELQEYSKSIGYGASITFTSVADHDGYKCENAGWCWKVEQIVGNGSDEESSSASTHTYGSQSDKAKDRTDITEYTSSYVDVMTFASIDIPIFNYFFSNMSLFRVTGATKTVNIYNN